MSWMKKWVGPFPLFVKSALGAHFTDVDDRDYIDLCLGDTGAMTGHSPAIVADVISRRVREGITLMLPTEDSVWVGETKWPPSRAAFFLPAASLSASSARWPLRPAPMHVVRASGESTRADGGVGQRY
jgi:hypothetical protein